MRVPLLSLTEIFNELGNEMGGYPRLPSGLSVIATKSSTYGDPIFDPTTLSVTVSPGETAQLPCRVRNLADKVVSSLF
ncbi:hypothetical protein O3M35_007573 [Rhynocoris fuscipes]|uniref:Ig-like domain-containing protein n=1 Tax=Rhynocoris fuscipes TaxID=488301 RepID=A0AAW1D9W5_9HEMI